MAAVRTEVYGVLTDAEGRVGLTATAQGLGLPGGVFDPSESAEAALMRLVKEATDLDVAVGSLTGVYQRPQDGRVALVFRADPLAGDFGALSWATPGAWPSGMAPGTALRVADALRSEGKSAYRLQ